MVLLGERLRGRHQRRLRAVLHGAQHRGERHHGLARPHLAHQQPLHRALPREVGVDLGDGALLVAGELERQRPAPAVHHHAARLRAAGPGGPRGGRGGARPRRAGAGTAPRRRAGAARRARPPRDRGSAPPRSRPARSARRLGGAQARRAAARSRRTRCGSRSHTSWRSRDAVIPSVAGCTGTSPTVCTGASEPPSSSCSVTQNSPAAAQLAVEQHRGPLAELAGDPGLAPPDRQQRPALVGHARLHALAAPVAGGLDRHRAHGDAHGGLLPQSQVGHHADVAAVAVRVRQMLEQVAHGRDPQRRRAPCRRRRAASRAPRGRSGAAASAAAPRGAPRR